LPAAGLEDKLKGWTGPSSDTERDKQERTERMIRQAVDSHPAFRGCRPSVYAKGSYANKTNVRTDSDVDVAVQCHAARYWDGRRNVPEHSTYQGIWTPSKLRSELQAALEVKFPGQVDVNGSTAFRIHSSTARVDADVVPCFDFTYYFADGNSRDGVMIHQEGRHPPS
jgi:predicted nucleotidyltransferase